MYRRMYLSGLVVALGVVFLVGACRLAHAADRDGSARMVLVELYTSQG